MIDSEREDQIIELTNFLLDLFEKQFISRSVAAQACFGAMANLSISIGMPHEVFADAVEKNIKGFEHLWPIG